MSRKLAKRQLVEPDYWTCPHGVRSRPEPALTYGPEVAEFCDAIGYTPDPQQELGLDLIFAVHPNGRPVSFSFCVICARQNLKSGLFLQAVMGWLFVMDDVKEIAWSAHLLSTSLGSLTILEQILTGSPLVSKYLMDGPTYGKYTANGQERFELNTGQKVFFQTRTINGSRGLGRPKVILDEAFALKPRMVGAILPIMLAQHNPQLLYGSSAPPNDPDSAQLRDVIDRGRNWKSPEMSYLEWLAPREDCADPDCDHPKDALKTGVDCALDREHLLRKANPTLTTGRITMETLRNLRQEMPADEYMRECLGWMDDDIEGEGPPTIDSIAWAGLADRSAPAPSKAAVVVDVEADLSESTIALSGRGPSGRTMVMYDTRPGTRWVAAAVEKLTTRMEVLEVSLHPGGKAKILLPALAKKDIEVEKLTSGDTAAGCAAIQTGVTDETLVHLGQTEIAAGIAVARTRAVGKEGAEVWDRGLSPVPLGPLVAGGTAVHRWELLAAENPEKPPPAPVGITAGTTADDEYYDAAPDWNNIET